MENIPILSIKEPFSIISLQLQFEYPRSLSHSPDLVFLPFAGNGKFIDKLNYSNKPKKLNLKGSRRVRKKPLMRRNYPFFAVQPQGRFTFLLFSISSLNPIAKRLQLSLIKN